ncbi:Hypothetical protein SRAE_1000001000 [Strongyloides ratti]|uniref:Serpentine receptor class gamma n=1 Tax=Strongyloides ratti TaxID=34506 RepID=A0A090MTT0_STRRB|nr:Hypothetical protein SRAE_1000001000 [Strongyloides ratti]CEF61733.1 Hypothetical protein SRAE_1000001000 [Strongyloides ratti]
MLKYYFITTFITSTAIGFVIAYYQPYYQWNEEIKALYLPCALIAILLNILAAYEYKKYRKKQWSIKMKKELNLLFYSVINLIAFLIFFVYFLFRSLHIIFNIPTLQNFAIMTIPWINDIRTFGLFYTSLIICKPLRNLVLLKKTNTVHYNTRKSFTSRTNILFKVSKK